MMSRSHPLRDAAIALAVLVVVVPSPGCGSTPEQRERVADAVGVAARIIAESTSDDDPGRIEEIARSAALEVLEAAAERRDAAAEELGESIWAKFAAGLGVALTIAGGGAAAWLRVRNRRSDARKSDLEEAVANLIEERTQPHADDRG